jgi:hypothetical protein
VLEVGYTEEWLLLVRKLSARWSQASDRDETGIWSGVIIDNIDYYGLMEI